MPRSLVLTLIAAHGLAVLALVAAVGWTHHKPRPCRATFERVQEGMTREKVEATVGGPPGSYRTPGALPPMRGGGWFFFGMECWTSDDATLHVAFSDEGTANIVYVNPIRCWAPTRQERLWSWVSTGYDNSAILYSALAVSGPYDVRTLWCILGL